MTREELIKYDSRKVRSDSRLTSIFKKFLEEDAKDIYRDGKIPAGCFGCQFNTHYNRWVRFVKEEKTMTKVKETKKENMPYALKDKNMKVFFKGKALSSKSSGTDWNEWINYPKDKDKVKNRKELFEQLPEKPKKEAKKKEEKKEVAKVAETNEEK